MNFLNLYYFLVVCQELNISKASERLFISQQSLSSHIQKLEKYFGTPLFNRSHPLTLTYAGERLAKSGMQIIDLQKQILNELQDINDQVKGKISIGISHTRGQIILPDILPEYNRCFPGIEIFLTEGNSVVLEEKLARGQIDLIIGFAPIKGENIETVHLRKETIYLIVPNIFLDSIFKGDTEAINRCKEGKLNIKDFADCHFLMMSTNNRVRMLADAYLAKNGIKPNIILQTENIETLFALCIQGMGITFYPEMFVEKMELYYIDDAEAMISAFPITDPDTEGNLVIAYSKNRYLSNAVKEFIKHTKDLYTK